MLKGILEHHIIFYIMGIMIGFGIISKCIVQVNLKRLVREAGNMNKSTHALMRLVRAKFEHNCMISDKVENVDAFVDKYLYEYHVCGLRFHAWRRLEIQPIWVIGTLGAIGASLSYSFDGMNDFVLWYGAFGAAGMILMFLIHNLTDEKYQLNAVHTYMVDYLENICAHRFAKAYHKKQDVPIQVTVQSEIKQSEELMKESVEEPQTPGDITEIEPDITPEVEQTGETELPPQSPQDIPGEEPWDVPSPADIPEESPQEMPKDMPEPLGEPQQRPQTDPSLDPQIAPTAEPEFQAAMIREILEEFLA